jgi:hypothetical protein
MIRHCVFLRFRPEVTSDQKSEIYAALEALVGRIEGLLAFTAGPNVSPEGKSRGYDDGFIMDLADRFALQRYLDDPDHKAAGARLVAALEGGRDGLIVFDLDMGS